MLKIEASLWIGSCDPLLSINHNQSCINDLQMDNSGHWLTFNYEYWQGNKDIDDFEQNDWLTIRHDLPERVDEAILQSNKWVTVTQHEGLWPSDPSSLEPLT